MLSPVAETVTTNNNLPAPVSSPCISTENNFLPSGHSQSNCPQHMISPQQTLSSTLILNIKYNQCFIAAIFQ